MNVWISAGLCTYGVFMSIFPPRWSLLESLTETIGNTLHP